VSVLVAVVVGVAV
jgi:hypothetical protein